MDKLSASKLCEDFYQQGWVIVPSLFDIDEIEKIKLAFDGLRAKAERLKTSQLFENASYVLGSQVEASDDERIVIKRVVWAGGSEPYLLSVGHNPRLLHLVSVLLGVSEFDHLLNQAHFKEPGDGIAFPWHQDIQHRNKTPTDWRDVDGRGSYVQSVLAIDAADEQSGPLQFVRGSSNWGRLESLAAVDYDQSSSDSVLVKAYQPKLEDVVTALLNPGDVVFFGPYTVHGSVPNMGSHPRRVLINGYAAPGANRRNYPGSGLGVRVKSDS